MTSAKRCLTCKIGRPFITCEGDNIGAVFLVVSCQVQKYCPLMKTAVVVRMTVITSWDATWRHCCVAKRPQPSSAMSKRKQNELNFVACSLRRGLLELLTLQKLATEVQMSKEKKFKSCATPIGTPVGLAADGDDASSIKSFSSTVGI